jgi:hypothetical protein
VWAKVKWKIPKKGKTFNISTVERQVSKDPDKLTQADRASCVFHAVKLQKDDYAKDLGHDKIFEPLVIILQDS